MRKFIARFRQAPMFSSVYILGAALSVASVMLVAIFLHVKTSNIYPEYSRDRLLYNPYVAVKYYDNTISGTYAPELANQITDSLRDIADVALLLDTPDKLVNVYVDEKRHENIYAKFANPGIFSVYNYEFVEGQPFAETIDPIVVISDRLAYKLFGTDHNIVGRKLNVSALHTGYFGSLKLDNKAVTICGVFKEGSRLLPLSFAEIIAPINLNQLLSSVKSSNNYGLGHLVGDLEMVILPKSGVDKNLISERIREVLVREASKPILLQNREVRSMYDFGGGGSVSYLSGVSDEGRELRPGEYQIMNFNYPWSSLQMAFSENQRPDEAFDYVGIFKLYGVLILILLLVPALNLSSLISGNMDSKMSEMGIRKAFGARNSTLLRQVINENLWLTGCGAILGIILSWVGVLLWKEWLFAGVGENGAQLSTFDIMLDPAMLFAPKVFVVAIVVCVTLNLLSSLIPAWWALRRPAIDAIKAKS